MLIAQSIKLCKKNHIESPICGKFARFTAKMFKIVIFNQVLNFCNHRRIPRTEFRRCTEPKSCCPPYSIRTISICPFWCTLVNICIFVCSLYTLVQYALYICPKWWYKTVIHYSKEMRFNYLLWKGEQIQNPCTF